MIFKLSVSIIIIQLICLFNGSKFENLLNVENKNQYINTQKYPSEDSIYEFLKFVIEDQKLNSSFKLNKKPYNRNISIQYEDSIFLSKFLIKKDTVLNDSANEISSYKLLSMPNCLTKEDINYILFQKNSNKNWIWDTKKFKFSKKNDQNWYCLSVPLFSVDYNFVIVVIYDGCLGLCGAGKVLSYYKEDKIWKNKLIETWFN